MASSSTSSTSISIKIFSDFSFRIKSFNPLLINFKSPSSKFKHSSTKTLSVRNVSTDPKLQDPLTPDQDSGSIASSIKYHAEFTPSFSPERFELPKAFFATAESVRDMLIINWNATYEYYEKANVKQAYYLSMEFLQGRALLNAIGNLELSGAYAEALTKLGYNLEAVAEQEPDPALGNGGLGRLASCFLDSLATLNYPAWGYGLRYKYGLFKQKITKDGQEEVAENWLEIGNPWEIVRNDISYPVKFYGEVITKPDGNKEWVGGEDIKAVAYDVPIPGYKTKTTINLRLWSTKVPSEVLDLRAFNAGEHAKAYEALTNAEKICYILYPGDETLEGKILRLKQQYTLCSASLQDIIARYEKRLGIPVNWEDFPAKVAVQMNDTHPTLCIPELIRILMDVKGLSWNEVWNITQKTVAYTNHTVLPEALEKWGLELIEKLLPRHVEIIKLIDEELINTIVAEYGTEDLELLQQKLQKMRIMDNIELPAPILESLVKPQDGSLITPTAEIESPSEDEPTEEKITSESSEDQEPIEKEDESEVLTAEQKQGPTFQPDPKQPKMVRMANLCVVGGHAVNGVAEIHSEIVKNDVFNDFFELWSTATMPNFFYSQLFVTPQVPNVRLDGQTIIVTGANVGLGFEATKHFVRMGASKVILACRDVNKGKAAQQSIERSTNVAKGALEVWQLDYSSYESVKSFAERVNGLSRLDAVVENAGINTRKWKMAEDNESHMTVNVVSNLLLAHLILPKLRESAKATGQDGRLAIVGSEVYMWAKFQEKNSEKLFAALNSEQQSNIGDRYNVSKLLLLFGVREFAKRNPANEKSPVIISILTPGFCKSNIFRDGDFTDKIFGIMANLIGRKTEVGSRTLVHAACPVHGREEHGEFLWDCKPAKVTGYPVSAEGQAMQKKFWGELTAKLEGIAPGSTGTL